MPAQSSKIISKTYCNEAWRTAHYSENGSIAPCCHFSRAIRNNKYKDLDQYVQSDWLADMQTRMINGDYVSGCENCYNKEARGEQSQRQLRNNMYGHITELNIRDLQINFGNTCNKTCNICRPSRSHLIAKQFDKIKNDDPNNILVKRHINNIYLAKGGASEIDIQQYINHLHTVEYLMIDGGEPFYTQQFTNLLEYMVKNNHTNISLNINTNGSMSEYQAELLSKFNHVWLALSIDGIYDLYEMVRSPHNWDWWNTNHNLILKHDFNKTYNCVVHCLNVHQVPEMIDYFLLNREKNNNQIFKFNSIVGNDYLTTNIVPIDVLQDTIIKIKQKYDSCTANEKLNLDSIIEHINYSINNRTGDHIAFRQAISTMSKTKNIDYQKYLPWSIE
jgi:organic radical activating enzyme